MSERGQSSWDFRSLRCAPPLLRDLGLTHTVTHTRKKADGDNGRESARDYAFLQQKCPESAEQQHSRGFQSLGKDGETCPCRNNTIINGADSSANTREISNIQHFYCVFQFAAFGLTTYLPTDREKPRDSGFCAPESLGSYQPTCFSNRSLSFSAAISAFIWGSSPPAAAHSPL